MKNLILFSLMMFISVFAFAQVKSDAGELRVQKKLDRMTEQLNLSADQQEQVKELLTTQNADHKKMKREAKTTMTPEERAEYKATRKAAKKDFDDQLNAILTPEQQASLKTLEKERKIEKKKMKRAKGKGKKHDPKKSAEDRAQRRVDRLTNDLNLSETQQAQILELITNRKSVKRKVKPENKKEMTEEERESMRAERKAEKAAYQEKFESILTAEQLEAYNKKLADKKNARKKARDEGSSPRKVH